MSDNSRLIAVVTGGGSGIGEAIAKVLAQEGYIVAILGRTESKLRRVVEDIQAIGEAAYYVCDVSDRTRVDQVFADIAQKMGAPRLLVNSAGINVVNRSMATLAPEDWDRVLAVHATGSYNCIRAVLPAMRDAGEGLIINISSIAGKRALELAGAAYCAGKFAMTALGMAAGLEERHHGIRITNIYPGEVNTPILEQRPEPVPQERREQMLQPEDLAEIVRTIVRLPSRAHVWEVVVTPLYQPYS
ncbi:MAG: SDR family oxidoreductase [Thermogutta sp.]